MRTIQHNIFGGEDLVHDTKKSKKETFNDYDGFVEKFKPKLTTDDCYTPQPVYDKIKQWVNDNILPLDGVEIVRPFYPGGDYEHHHYPDNCLVLDTPPFSILAKIRHFYHANGIRYFLYGPTLTLANSAKELIADTTYIICKESITYENGATVATGFITNLDCGGTGIWVSGSLTRAIEEGNRMAKAAKAKTERPAYVYPPCVYSPAILRKMAVPGIEFRVPRSEMAPISALDSQRPKGKAIFGGGWFISERATAERAAAERAAAERAAAERAAAERAAAGAKEYWSLSERERLAVARLSRT